MSLFRSEYAFTMDCKLPDGEKEVIRITGTSMEDLNTKVFLAGFNFAQDHPDLIMKGSQ